MFGLIKEKFWSKNWYSSPLVIFSLSIFFWTLFDAILTYIAPLMMEERGISIAMIGLIIGSSSVTGAIFDYVFCRVFKNHDFRFVFMVMYCICFLYPLILMQSKGIWLFLLAMGVWGIYYDLSEFGAFNFVGRHSPREHHVGTFGMIGLVKSVAYLIGPLFAGFLVVKSVDWRTFVTGWFLIVISFIFFVLLWFSTRKSRREDTERKNISHKRSSLLEIKIWRKLIKSMSPTLYVKLFIISSVSLFWTLSPIFVDELNFGWYGGLFLAATELPYLFTGVFVERITKRLGNMRTAVLGLLFSSLSLMPFFLTRNPILLICIIFISFCFASFALPAVNASYADKIESTPQYEGEIESLEDFVTNIACIIGPIFGGVLASITGISVVLSVLGAIGVALALVLMYSYRLKIKRSR